MFGTVMAVALLGFTIRSYSGAGIGFSTNAAGVNNGLVTQLSVASVNGAFVSVAGETGSPGRVSAAPASAIRL